MFLDELNIIVMVLTNGHILKISWLYVYLVHLVLLGKAFWRSFTSWSNMVNSVQSYFFVSCVRGINIIVF